MSTLPRQSGIHLRGDDRADAQATGTGIRLTRSNEDFSDTSKESRRVWLSILLHLFAAMSLSVASALTCRALLILPSWAGVLVGLCLYAAAFAGTFMEERSEGE